MSAICIVSIYIKHYCFFLLINSLLHGDSENLLNLWLVVVLTQPVIFYGA